VKPAQDDTQDDDGLPDNTPFTGGHLGQTNTHNDDDDDASPDNTPLTGEHLGRTIARYYMMMMMHRQITLHSREDNLDEPSQDTT
jgi:hypothetical protein